MAKNTFDAILASSPLNATAGRVTSRGTHYEQQFTQQVRKYSDLPTHSDAPFKCVPMPIAPSFVDLTGRKYGRLTVIGYLGRLNPKNQKKASWAVRCVCGDYETRSGAAIKGANESDACRKCIAWRVTQNRYKRQGARPIGDFVRGRPSQLNEGKELRSFPNPRE